MATSCSRTSWRRCASSTARWPARARPRSRSCWPRAPGGATRPPEPREYDRGVAVASLLSLDDVLAARETIAGRLHRTPVFTSATLSRETGGRVYLKAELFQRTGSFKPRGVLTKLARLSEEEKRRGVISISAGNHAQALAYASALEGIDALVVMWESASPMKVAAARGYGATVDTEAPDIPSAFERLEQLTAETGRTLVHPYDDPLVMAGQVAVGPELSDALHASLEAGRTVTVEPRSAADGLNGPYAGPNCVTVCAGVGVESALVTEEALEDAFRFLYGRAKLACELAGAATTAALRSGAVALEPGETAVAVVSGGNVAPEVAAAILARR